MAPYQSHEVNHVRKQYKCGKNQRLNEVMISFTGEECWIP